jgi:molecular chaperone GrpE
MQEQEKQAEQVEQAAPQEDVTQAEQAEAQAAPLSAEAMLTEKLTQVEAQVAELQDAFLRAKAEAENTRRRAQDDITKAHKFAVESFASSMLGVKDSLEMALKVEAPSVESLKEGVEITLKQLVSAFEKNRLTEVIPEAGEPLDPMRHQAISMVPSEQEANTVVEVLQKGYMLADRLLRPAIVTVAAAK